MGVNRVLGRPQVVHDTAALQDMAVHGTLVGYVERVQRWWHGTGPLHFRDPCRACVDKQSLDQGGTQGSLL